MKTALAFGLGLLIAAAPPGGTDWAREFDELQKAYYREKEKQGEIAGKLAELLEGVLDEVRDSAEAVAAYELLSGHEKLFRADERLQKLLPEFEKAYFQGSLKTATGPFTLRALKDWCEKKKFKDEAAQVEAVLAKVKPPARPSRDYRQREKAREARAEARKVVHDFLRGYQREVSGELAEIADWMEKEKYAPEEARGRIRALIVKLSGAEDSAVLEKLDALEHGAEESKEKKLERDFERRLEKILKSFAQRLLKATEKCLSADEPGLAFDLFQTLLRVDPENDRAHKGLGHIKIEGKWLRPYEAQQWKAGFAWDDKLGWVLRKQEERYKSGEYYDLAERKWDKMERWNELHSDPKSPWKLRSEHFELITTVDLPLAVTALRRLEAFFLQLFRQYDVFFGGGKRSAELIFGISKNQQVLKVTIYRDQQQFKEHAKPPTEWAAGFYSGGLHGSYFFAFDGKISFGVLQHELTHQILGEFSPGHAPSWLSEGAAVYLQDAEIRDGELDLGGLRDNGRVALYRKNLREGKQEHSFRDMLAFQGMKQWNSGNIAANYRGAGALVFFLMKFDDGRCRGDFIEMLRDGYGGGARSPEDYFGLSLESLEALMERFYKECEHE